MASPQKQIQVDEKFPSERFGKHRLDELDPGRVARNLTVFHPQGAVVDEVMTRARLAIPGLATTAAVLRVLDFNPRCMFGVTRRARFDADHPVAEGFIAVLPLNALGLQQLLLGAFDGANPDLRFIAPEGEKPAGVYMWGVYAPGALAAGMALFMAEMSAPHFAGVNLYSRPNTEVGRRFNEVLGFREGVTVNGINAPNVWCFTREPQRPLYDSYIPGSAPGTIGITVARSFDDLMKVLAVRNSVYVSEQECPYDEEYDGNDLSATHLLAYIGKEPVGCLRLRFFADFAKFERMAIRKEYRKSRAAIQLARAGFQFCQKKGYTKVYGHIHDRLVPFWSRFGFRVPANARHFNFSDFNYVEIVADIPRDPDAITLAADPYTIIRPEGRWHVPGVLEQSAARPATHPSVDGD